jgi:hypothetical protein
MAGAGRGLTVDVVVPAGTSGVVALPPLMRRNFVDRSGLEELLSAKGVP